MQSVNELKMEIPQTDVTACYDFPDRNPFEKIYFKLFSLNICLLHTYNRYTVYNEYTKSVLIVKSLFVQHLAAFTVTICNHKSRPGRIT
jgi:hypothetical protein